MVTREVMGSIRKQIHFPLNLPQDRPREGQAISMARTMLCLPTVDPAHHLMEVMR